MKRGGQLTIFVIIGLVLIIFLSLSYFLVIKFWGKQTRDTYILNNDEIDNVNLYVKSCLEKVGKEGTYLIAKQGGILSPNKNSYEQPYFLTDYYLKDSVNVMPPLTDLEDQLSLYVSMFLDYCIDDFNAFPYDINGRVGQKIFKMKLNNIIF